MVDGFYVTAEGADAIRRYKYSGGDLSLLYKYLLSPVAQRCVDWFCPAWLAPNLITLIGLFAVMFSHCLTWYYIPNLTEEEVDAAPLWLWALCGACLAFYSNMDNMDGKQARKIGASSALGLLFDHGCDAINGGMLAALPVCCMIRTGLDPMALFGMWCIVAVPFFFATWEEYHTGTLVLPIVNGPSEGVYTTVVSYFATAIVTPKIWGREALEGFTLSQALVSVGVAGAALTCAYQTFNVCVQESNAGKSVLRALYNLFPMANLIGVTAVWLVFEPQAATEYPRLFFLTIGMIFSDHTVKLMLAHATESVYHCNYFMVFVFTAVAGEALLPTLGYASVIDDAYTLQVLSGLAAASLSHFVVFGYGEVRDALGIQFFTVQQKQE